MSVADYTVFGEIVTGSKILVAEYPSKPGGCGIWYKLPNGNKQTAFPKAELEAFFRSQNLDIEIQVNLNDGTELDRQLIWTDEGFTIPFSHMFVTPRAGWYYGLLAYMWSSAAKAAVHNKAALKLLRERC